MHTIEGEREQRLKEMGTRLKIFRKQLGYKNQERFASDLGITRAAYKNYEAGKTEPPSSVLHSLSLKFNADINYILTGKGKRDVPAINTYLTQMNIDDMARTIVKSYMDLPPKKRKIVKEYIDGLIDSIERGSHTV